MATKVKVEPADQTTVKMNGKTPTDGANNKEKTVKPKQTKVESFTVETDSMEEKDCDEPTHQNMCCKVCTPHHSTPCKFLYFLVLLGLDVADLVSDWLLFIDIYLVQEGLVYGPPEASAMWALLAFSIVGILTFVFEAVNLWWEVFRNNPWLDTDLVSMVTIWIEDLPQIAINVYIAWCREDPISMFQLSKAAIVLLALLIRIIISSVKYCNKAALREAKEKTTESRRHVGYRVFIMLGLLINSACAIAVFMFTQTQQDIHGNIVYQVPTSVFEDKYNDEKYFQNVSVFVHHPDFDTQTPSVSTDYEAHWVRFMSINDIRDRQNLDISYNYVYEKTNAELRMALYMKTADDEGKLKQGKWDLSECYSMDRNSHAVTSISNTTCQNKFFTPSAISVFLTFSFTPPERFFRKLIFGDIRFNIKVYVNGTCTEYDDFTNRVGSGANASIPAIHYYRINATIPTDHQQHLLQQSGSPRFYRNDGVDLEDVTSVWKTGFWKCDSSGSVAPHLDRKIPTECSNIGSHVFG